MAHSEGAGKHFTLNAVFLIGVLKKKFDVYAKKKKKEI